MNVKNDLLFGEDKIDIEPTNEELQAVESYVKGLSEIEEDEFETNGDDIVAKYFKEINKYPLLTRDDEISLAKRIELGEEGVFKQFFSSNTKLVVKIAKRYSIDERHLKLLDLIQEGNLGLMVAVRKYDWRHGFKFSTYASWWIQSFILRAIAGKTNTIHLSQQVSDEIYVFKKTLKALANKLGRFPSSLEIAREMKVRESDVRKLLEIKDDAQSLNAARSSDEDAPENGSMIENQTAECPERMAELSRISKSLEAAISKLSDAEREVFTSVAIKNQKYTEIAERLSIKEFKVKKIYASVKGKLSRDKQLSCYKEFNL